jgi:hypothetical protein
MTEAVSPDASTTMPTDSTVGKWKVERVHEKSTGYRGISIFDEHGLRIANMVMQLTEDELEKAKMIVKAVNAWREANA